MSTLITFALAVVFVLAFSHVTGSLDAPLPVAIYGLGVSTGTYWVDDRPQHQGVVSPTLPRYSPSS